MKKYKNAKIVLCRAHGEGGETKWDGRIQNWIPIGTKGQETGHLDDREIN